MKPIRNPDSPPGDWYIDTACIDCGASRHVAPDLVIERNGKSVFARQPETPDEQLAAWRAVLVCPTASVRSETKQPRPLAGPFPQPMTEGVWRCGFNARSSFGAHSYFAARADGNLLVDSPRYAAELVKWFEDAGGIAHFGMRAGTPGMHSVPRLQNSSAIGSTGCCPAMVDPSIARQRR